MVVSQQPLRNVRLMRKGVEVAPPAAWTSDLRLHVPAEHLISTMEPIRPDSATHARPLIAISSHADYAGVWTVERFDRSTLVCFVPRYEEEALPPPQFDLVFSESDGEHNPAVVPPRSLTQEPRVYCLPRLRGHIRMTIYMLDAIDTVAQTFRADSFIEVRLRNICSEPVESRVEAFIRACGLSAGLIDFLNASEFQTERERWQGFTPSSAPGAVEAGYDYVMKLRAKSTFTEQFELAEYPFDRQLVTVTVTVNTPSTRVQLVPNAEFPSLFLSQSFQLGAVFTLPHGSRVLAEASLSDASESSAGIMYPRCAFSIELHRKYEYYLNNIVYPVGVITLATPLSAATQPDGTRMDTGSRLSYSVTMLLTAVAYKFVIASSIPQVSYLTLVESYTLVCFMFMWVNLVESAIWPTCGYTTDSSGDVVERFNEWIYVGAFLAAFLAYNLRFWFVARSLLRKRQGHAATNRVGAASGAVAPLREDKAAKR